MRGRKKKAPKLYYIEWLDPASVHTGWFDLTEAEINKLVPAEIKSVGWIIKENKEYIVLASSLIEKDNMGSGDTTILKGLIRKKVELPLESN